MIGLSRFVPQESTAEREAGLRISQITSMDGVDYVVDEPVQISILLTKSVDFVNGMQDSGVMLASKHATDLGQ